jgi:hypothetical protein
LAHAGEQRRACGGQLDATIETAEQRDTEIIL